MSDNVVPQQKCPKLVVVVAFDRGEDGDLFPVFGPATSRLWNELSKPPKVWQDSMPA